MAKYHIGENGPARCRALVRACPIGGDHFEGKTEAQAEYERQLSDRYNALTGAQKAAPELDLNAEASGTDASSAVATALDHVEGEVLDSVPASDLKPGDLLPDGRVVKAVFPVPVSGSTDVYFMDDYDEYPPGFSYDHFPLGGDEMDEVAPTTSYPNVFRPATPKRVRLTSPGGEVRDGVGVQDLRSGDRLGDGRVVSEVQDSGETALPVVVYFESPNEAPGGSEEFSSTDTLDSVWLNAPR